MFNILAIHERHGMRLIACYRPFAFILLFMLCCTSLSVAQEVDYDYKKYKFYAEDKEDEILSLAIADTITQPAINTEAFTIYDNNIRYALYNAGYKPRGANSSEESYTLGGITLLRSTAQRLLSLGIARNTEQGIHGAIHSGATLSTTELLVGRERNYRHEGHTIKGELSGRNYLGGVTYRTSWLPTRNGVRLDGEWSITHNTRIRAGEDMYVEGVYTNALDCGVEASYYNRRHSISLAAILSYNQRGLRQASTEEAFSLTKNPLYNPSWGMQSDKVRNSRELNNLHPEVIAVWDYRLTAATTLHIAADISYQLQGITSLAWFNTITPMPDNYRYMPSYHSLDAQLLPTTEAWENNDLKYTQVDWDGLYHTNLLQQDGHSRYAVAERMESTIHSTVGAHIESRIANIQLIGGITLSYDGSHNFKVMDDLLGGSHIIDRDYYLINDATFANRLQNNLLSPDRRIEDGDRYGYDYRLNTINATAYGYANWDYNSGNMGVALSLSTERTHRRGYYEKELFPGDGSYGRSAPIKMLPYYFATRWAHYINNHRIGTAIMIRGTSPQSDNMFLQSEYNNRIVKELSLTTTIAGEACYSYIVSNKLTLAATLFATYSLNNCDVLHYYDDLAGEYTDCVVRDIDTFIGGIEAKANVEWSRYFDSSFMLSAFTSRYTDNATVELYADTNNAHIATSSSHIAGYKTGVPQLAAYGDVGFRHAGWSLRAAVHYCGMRYISPSFVRRSERVLSRASSAEHRNMLMSQQRLDDNLGIDFSLSKWFNFDKLSLGIQFTTRNLLGNSNILSGYEQNRVRRITIQNRTHLEPFDNRVTYGYPRQFYLSITLRI